MGSDHVLHLGDSARRFAERWEPEPNSGCWLWLGSPCSVGYGKFWIGGKQERSHRAAWMLHRGPIPADMYVCHRCDNRGCVNPAHLFLGTHLDNIHDMQAKGRARGAIEPGELHARARLRDTDVATIRARALAGENQSVLAAEFGVTRGYVSTLKIGRRRG